MILELLEDTLDEQDQKEIDTSDLLETKITYKTKNMDIESILNSLKRGDYLLPKYQRKFVWSKEQSSNLILSLIKNIPIPPLYLYYQKSTGKYIILDGQQRITSLFMYYRNIFYKGKKERIRIDFRDIAVKLDYIDEINEKLDQNTDDYSNEEIEEKNLKIKEIYAEIEEKYNISKSNFKIENEKDITFENFDEKAKRILRRKDIETVFVQCDSENPNKVYSDIFKLLNSAGKELSSQEIRNGIFYQNSLYDLIAELNTNNRVWRYLYGGNSLIFKDFEYLVRFLSLDYFSSSNNEEFKIQYDGTFSYSNIIDDFSELFNLKYINENSKDKNEIEKLNELNKEITDKAKIQVNKLNRFFDKIQVDESIKIGENKSLLILEAIFLAFSKLDLLNTDISLNYIEFFSQLDKKEFDVSTSTSNKGTIEKRVTKAIKIIKESFC